MTTNYEEQFSPAAFHIANNTTSITLPNDETTNASLSSTLHSTSNTPTTSTSFVGYLVAVHDKFQEPSFNETLSSTLHSTSNTPTTSTSFVGYLVAVHDKFQEPSFNETSKSVHENSPEILTFTANQSTTHKFESHTNVRSEVSLSTVVSKHTTGTNYFNNKIC